MAGRLAGIALLDSLPAAEVDRLEQASRWRRFAAGEPVLDRACIDHDVFFIAEGEVQIVNFSLSGRPVAYAMLKAGAYFGEISAIDGEARTASAVAATDCLIGRLPPDQFRRLLTEYPEIAMRVMRRLAAIVRNCDERIMDLATLGAMQRVVVELVRQAKPDPITAGSWLLYPCPAQREIAIKASTTRETVARVFTQLQESGLVRRRGRSVYLTDRDALERLAQRLDPRQAAAPPGR